MSIESLESVVVAVPDLGSARDTYARLLGAAGGIVQKGPDVQRVRFRLAAGALDLVTPAGDSSWLQLWLEARGEGPLGVVLGCSDFDAVEAQLARYDVPLLDDVEPLGAALEPKATGGLPIWLDDLANPADVPSDLGVVMGIEHAVVRTRDPDRSKRLFEEAFGMEVVQDRVFEERQFRLVEGRLGPASFELTSSTKDGGGAAHDHLWGITWRVGSADGAQARLEAEGLDVSEVRQGFRRGTRVFTVRDGACGVPTLMVERP